MEKATKPEKKTLQLNYLNLWKSLALFQKARNTLNETYDSGRLLNTLH